MNNKYSVSGKSVTIILKGFFSCKKIMRITKDFSSLLLVTKYNAIVLWRKPLNVETVDYVQIPWVWPRGVLPKTQKRSNAPHAGHAFATNPLLSPWVARGLPGGRPLGMAADTRIMSKSHYTNQTVGWGRGGGDRMRYLFTC